MIATNRWACFVLAFSIVSSFSANAQEASETSDLQNIYLEAKKKVEAMDLSSRTALFSKYAEAVGKLQVDFQQKGDLDNALKAKKEIELARSLEIGTEDFPEIARFRDTLSTGVAEIEAERDGGIRRLQQIFIERFSKKRSDLTKAGKLEEAVAVDKAIKMVEAEITQAAKASAPPTPGQDSSPPIGPVQVTVVDQYVSNSKLKGDKLTGEVKVDAGKHRLTDRVALGDREVKKGQKAKSGKVTIPSGSSIEGGEIYIDVGELHARETRFDEVRLMANLGGKLFAEGCLFEKSTVEKAGGWSSGFSSKWTLKNCVVHKTLAGGRFDRGTVGLNFSYTTFVEVKFPVVGYRSDFGKEAQEAWRKVENCRFIRCEIPRSFLMMTNNCVFEDCTFPERGDVKPLGSTGLTVTLYHNGLNFSAPPKYGRITFIVADGRTLTPVPGSTVKYELENRELVFD